MSTKISIKYRHSNNGIPGFHLYTDVMDGFGDDTEEEMPVYLQLDGVHVIEMATLINGGASVTLRLPRELACALGLMPSEEQIVASSPSQGN